MLRGFRSTDLPAFAAMNADPRVMEHYLAPLSRAQSDDLVERVAATWEERGFGLWAVEVRSSGEFIGYAGLWPVPAQVPVRRRASSLAVEVGWRLAVSAWGHGYATEGAREALRFAFDEVCLDQVVSFTSVQNLRSQRVMQRLGMQRDGEFEHPALPVGHRLRPHVLYRLTRSRWRSTVAP